MTGIFSFLLFSLPTAWSGFSSEPFFPWLAKQLGFSIFWITTPITGILFVVIIWSLFGVAIRKFVHRNKSMSLILFVTSFAALGFLVWYAIFKLPFQQATGAKESKSKGAPVAVPSSTPELPPTLHDLYATDFPGFAHFANEGELHAKSPDENIEKVRIAYTIHMDFAAKSRFISVYIASSPATYHTCKEVPNFYHEILDEADKTTEMIVQRPGDSATEHSKELTFTGKIYVYHEDNLTLEQLGSLEALYKSKNLSPQFRGRSYATTMWLAAKASGSPIPSHSDKAQIDSIDALREEGRKLQRAFASPTAELPDGEPDRWLEKVQLFLRSLSRSYADHFDEILKDPRRHTGGGLSPAFTHSEMSQWENDPRRQLGWPCIAAVLRYLDEVRQELYSKLP